MPRKYKPIVVSDKKTKKEFLQFPVRLYAHEKAWIRPLDEDIEKVFDPRKNDYFAGGEAIRWILIDGVGQTVGRVAAFCHHDTALKDEQPTGGMGFFECLDDHDAAFLLFDTCKQWLSERNMEAMDGPVNFGDRHTFWGLLIDGFIEQSYCIPYNFPYYRNLFEDYGFINYYNQFTYHRRLVEEGLSSTMKAKAERIFGNPSYRFEHIDKKKLEQVKHEFRSVYNRAWAKFPGVVELTEEYTDAMVNSIKPILDDRLVWFGYYNDEPIAFFIGLPEINQVIRYLNGRMDLIGMMKFLYHLKIRRSVTKIVAFLFGVVPEHQGKGIESALVIAWSRMALREGFPYKELELNWIGDYNLPMIHLVSQIGCTRVKTHATYRYLFDRRKEFTRARLSF